MLQGKVAIVTGAAQGIGAAIARELARQGAAVALADLKIEQARTVAAEIENAGGRALPLAVDVSSVEQLRAMAAQTAQALGGVDILINNAGILHSTAIEDITEDEWDRMMAVNLKSVFFASQQALPYMKARGGGRIVNMSSLAGRMGGFANGVGYSASKAGIIGLTRALARRLAPYNITVNALAPGTTRTDILRSLSPEKVAELEASIPLGRLGEPQDIASTVAFLAGPGASFITGAVLDVNGGLYMG